MSGVASGRGVTDIAVESAGAGGVRPWVGGVATWGERVEQLVRLRVFATSMGRGQQLPGSEVGQPASWMGIAGVLLG